MVKFQVIQFSIIHLFALSVNVSSIQVLPLQAIVDQWIMEMKWVVPISQISRTERSFLLWGLTPLQGTRRFLSAFNRVWNQFCFNGLQNYKEFLLSDGFFNHLLREFIFFGTRKKRSWNDYDSLQDKLTIHYSTAIRSLEAYFYFYCFF